MSPADFEARIVDWARRQRDVEALVQIGSRVQSGHKIDALADWDFHLITSDRRKYYNPQWISAVATPWCAHVEISGRGNMKTSAVFEGGVEADFVPLVAWQMKLVYWGMKNPHLVGLMPSRLHRGILETRVILLNSGFKVLVGGRAWEKRLTALNVDWPWLRLSSDEYAHHVSAFWQKAVWVAKKVARPEPRSALHWLHKLVVEHVYALLEEEAWLAGKKARPEALKAERWLNERRLSQTALTTSIDQRVLARALLSEIVLFEEVSASVAQSSSFDLKDYTAVARWLRELLTPLARDN